MNLKAKFVQKGLSARESEVAVKVVDGNTNKQVACELFVTEKTVKFHLTNIFKKLGIKSRAQLISSSLVDLVEIFKEKEEELKLKEKSKMLNLEQGVSNE